MDIAQFREDFPEFADVTVYPDATVTFWSGIGEKMLIATRWADLYAYGLELFTAHQLALAANDQKTVAMGGTPGQATEVKSGKSVGGVSVSLDTAASIELNAGHWNLTTYGRQFIRLARIAGMGGAQL